MGEGRRKEVTAMRRKDDAATPLLLRYKELYQMNKEGAREEVGEEVERGMFFEGPSKETQEDAKEDG